MKLSEAILLGSTVMSAKPGRQYFSDTKSGCALGMAAIARGCRLVRVSGPVPVDGWRTCNAEGVWGGWVLYMVPTPCECWAITPHEMRIKDIIAHIFDHHVMTKSNWTLEQLAAWVATFEAKYARPPVRYAGRMETPPWQWVVENEFVLAKRFYLEQLEENEWQARVAAFKTKTQKDTKPPDPALRRSAGPRRAGAGPL